MYPLVPSSNLISVVNEMESYATSLPRYGSQAHKSRLGEGLRSAQFFSDRMLLVELIRKGIPTTLFLTIKDLAPFSDEEWSDFLDISLKSLQRYQKEPDYLFKSIHSEKIIELTEVTVMGLEVFDNAADFGAWLNTPSPALGGKRPLELLKDSYGQELVIQELHRIDQGIFV
ncbi:MAG: antitoxin Xre/MbcA/ParS toxin-binding domain-containing protein [Algoriphagus sp.]